MRSKDDPRVSVFVGASLDGFIAREDGDIKWLEQASDAGVDYGFNEFFARIDALVMGRNTFDIMRRFPTWYYGDKPVIVLTHRPLVGTKKLPKTVEAMTGEPAEIVVRLAKRGLKRLYVDGGKTIQEFLRADLVDELVVSRLPILIGSGIPLFGPLSRDIHLKHLATRTFPGGMIQSSYEIVRAKPLPRTGGRRKPIP